MTDKLSATDRIRQLEAAIKGFGLTVPAAKPLEKNPDYIEHGSPRHAAMLGIQQLAKGEDYSGPTITAKDGNVWRFLDGYQFQFGHDVAMQTENLRQRVSVLTSEIPKPQSVDPFKPNFAPTMWVPAAGRPFRQTTED